MWQLETDARANGNLGKVVNNSIGIELLHVYVSSSIIYGVGTLCFGFYDFYEERKCINLQLATDSAMPGRQHCKVVQISTKIFHPHCQ